MLPRTSWPLFSVSTPGTKMADCYGTTEIDERHRHRYEFNNEFRAEFEEKGLVIAGTSPDGRLVEAVEIPGRDFHLGAQFHPERSADTGARILHNFLTHDFSARAAA